METKEIVKYETPQGEVVLTPEIVRKYLVSGSVPVSDQEIKMFLSLCIYQKLNPFLREVYLIKYKEGQPAAMVTGKETFLKRAVRNPKYAGHKTGITANDAGNVVSAWAEVYVSGYQVPIRCEVDFEEYCQYAYNYETKQKKPNRFWSEKPKTMLKKVALVQALREAFPEDFGGLYSQEEMPIGERLLPTEPVFFPSAEIEEPKSRSHPTHTQEPVTIDQIPEPKPKVPQIAPINDLEPKTPTNTLPDTQDMQPKEAEGQEANKKHIVTEKEIANRIMVLALNNKDIARGIMLSVSSYVKDGEIIRGIESLKGAKLSQQRLNIIHGKLKELEKRQAPEELKYNEPQDDETQTPNPDHPDLKSGDIPIPPETVDGLMELVGTLNETQYGLVRGKLLVDNSFKLNKEMTLQEMFAELLPDDADDIRVYIEKTLLKR